MARWRWDSEVGAEFRRNFAARGELGAACAIYWRGERVVDLWGGYRDAGRRAHWEEDTLVLVYSTTKVLAAMILAVANAHGWLDYDAPVVAYWPEFAQHGKARITVRQLLAHRAGLCALDTPLALALLADLDALAAVLARQRPAWEPGTRQGYDYLSLGLYEGELIRRVDPRHRRVGQVFRDEIAAPLGLEFYIGLPPDVPAARLASIRGFQPWEMLLHPRAMPWRMVLAFMTPGSLARRTLTNPKLRSPADLDRPEYRALELPAAVGTGRCGASPRPTAPSRLGVTSWGSPRRRGKP